MRIQPFQAWRPTVATAAKVASVPYDVVNRSEAAALIRDNPLSFLRVTRSEVELPESTSPYADEVYAKAREHFLSLQQRGALMRELEPALYLYRQVRQGRAQRGLVACCHVGDYEANLIKKHEKTRQDKEDDRCRHILAVRAHSGLVFLTYRDNAAVDSLTQAIEVQAPLYDFTAVDGVQHTVWRAANSPALVKAFEAVPCVYIADGHHRAAGAVRVAAKQRAEHPTSNGREAYNWFPAVLFPASQLTVLPYNRCVHDLNGLTESGFIAAIQQRFTLAGNANPTPPGPGHVAMYLGGNWYQLSWKSNPHLDPVSALDVSVLQNSVLASLLGITDPRTDKRIEFIGGVRGTDELEQRVKTGAAAVAFSMFPVTVDQLMAVADAGQCLPPKSTWFEPKLRDGLLTHTF